MASEKKSFQDLVKEAPAAPAAGTVSLVGTLAQSSEAGKFVLTLQDGSTVTLETASVKGYAVLGTSVGQTIVRVDIDAAKIPTLSPSPSPWTGGAVPFALATPQQVPPGILAARQGAGNVPAGITVSWWDQPGTVYWVDKRPIDDTATGVPPWLD